MVHDVFVSYSSKDNPIADAVVAVDLSDPANPYKVAVYSELDETSSVFAGGDLVFVTDSSRGLIVLSKPE